MELLLPSSAADKEMSMLSAALFLLVCAVSRAAAAMLGARGVVRARCARILNVKVVPSARLIKSCRRCSRSLYSSSVPDLCKKKNVKEISTTSANQQANVYKQSNENATYFRRFLRSLAAYSAIKF